ncbi:MAG TPA: hypothetical protein VIF84_11660 [Candidatus Limnocylindrales bacterium]|jgi:hypothetical protein
MRAGLGFLWLILGIVTLGIVGAVAYQAGVTAGLTASATETAVAVVPAYGFGWGFGWIFFPILFLFLLFGLFAFIGSRRRGWGGSAHGYPGYGWGGRGWDPSGVAPDDLPPPIRSTLERWHAGAHAPAAPGSGPGTSIEPPTGQG